MILLGVVDRAADHMSPVAVDILAPDSAARQLDEGRPDLHASSTASIVGVYRPSAHRIRCVPSGTFGLGAPARMCPCRRISPRAARNVRTALPHLMVNAGVPERVG